MVFTASASWLCVSLLLLLGCFVTPASGAVCAGLDYYVASTTSETFTTPDYPSNYGINVYCTWLIEANDSSHNVRLTVDPSAMENPDGGGSCSYDYARAYDGNDMSSDLLGEWCGTSAPVLTSTGSLMLIVFRSDYSTVSTGFVATYMAGTFAVASSSEDYTVIIASSTTAFIVIVGGVIAFCCIRQKLKRNKDKKADQQRLPENAEADNEKYQSEGGRSLFTQRILPSRQGKRLQPLELATEDSDQSPRKPITAAGAAGQSTDPQGGSEIDAKKAGETSSSKPDQTQKPGDDNNKKKPATATATATTTAGQQKGGNNKKRGKAKVGFEETTQDIGTSDVSPTHPGSETTAAVTDQASTTSSNAQSDAAKKITTTTTSGGPGGQKDAGHKKDAPGKKPGGQMTREGSKMVLLPTVVMVDNAADLKRQKVEGKWEQVSSNKTSSSSTSAAASDSNGRPAHSANSLEKDEGIHLDYEGESGKSSPASRPSTSATLVNRLQRESSVVSPSLVTSSFLADTPSNQPVPIEAPSAVAGNILDGAIPPPRASTAVGQRGTRTTKPPPVKDAFLNMEDPNAIFQKAAAPMSLNGQGKPGKAPKQETGSNPK